MRKNSCEFKTAFLSEAGTIKTNKDYFAFVELDDFACWIAADGIDSDEEMESAELAVKSIFSDFSEKPSMSRGRLKKYIKNAHKLLKSESRNVRLKSSIIMVVTNYSRIVWVSAGNTRLYLFRKGRLGLKSKDQSIAQLAADSGKITHDEIAEHEERFNLTNYLGKPSGFSPYISKKHKLMDGDVLVLCTSGIWENIDSMEMMDAVGDVNDPSDLVDILEELLLGKQKKVLNNYTVAAVYANKVFKEKTRASMKPVLKRITAVVLSIAIMVAGVLIFKKVQAAMNEGKTRAAIIKLEKTADGMVKDGTFEKALKKYEQPQNKLETLKVADEEGEERVNNKSLITQLIVDGNVAFKNKDYYGAKVNYQKAGNEIDQVDGYDKKKLEEKMSEIQKYINAIELVQQADELVGTNVEAALSKYKEAKKIAELLFFDEKIQEINSKIVKIEDTNKKYNQAKSFENTADKAMSSKNYAGAISNFDIAKSLYNEILRTADVSRVDGKIKKANDAIEKEAEEEKKAEEAKKAAEEAKNANQGT